MPIQFVFLLIGGVLVGISVSRILHTKTWHPKSKRVKGRKREYYTLGQWWWLNIKLLGRFQHPDHKDKADKARQNPLPDGK